MSLKVTNVFFSIFGLIVACLFVLTLKNYPGNSLNYCLFSAAFFALLYFGFRKKRIFFDTFIAIYLFLGFWIKFSVMLATENPFYDPVGSFDYSAQAFDHSLSVITCAISALLLASLIREKFFFSYAPTPLSYCSNALNNFYQRHKRGVLLTFIALIIFIGVTNAIWGIYQRGRIPQVFLPFRLGGVYTWLLTFGLSSLAALILTFEFRSNKEPEKIMYLLLFESFFSNVSMLSRGFILNTSSILIGFHDLARRATSSLTLRFKLRVAGSFIFLFLVSIFVVNIIRTHLYADIKIDFKTTIKERFKPKGIEELVITLFVQRWVGIEGALAVSSYPGLGWELYKEAWSESFSNTGTSFYDLKIVGDSPYKNMEASKHHFITLPGFIAFFFYPGSYLHLFLAVLVIALMAAFLEFLAFKFAGGSLVFCALIAQVIAYRLAHFGYVPRQSYLLFGTILLNIFLVYLLNRGVQSLDTQRKQLSG